MKRGGWGGPLYFPVVSNPVKHPCPPLPTTSFSHAASPHRIRPPYLLHNLLDGHWHINAANMLHRDLADLDLFHRHVPRDSYPPLHDFLDMIWDSPVHKLHRKEGPQQTPNTRTTQPRGTPSGRPRGWANILTLWHRNSPPAQCIG